MEPATECLGKRLKHGEKNDKIHIAEFIQVSHYMTKSKVLPKMQDTNTWPKEQNKCQGEGQKKAEPSMEAPRPETGQNCSCPSDINIDVGSGLQIHKFQIDSYWN